MSKKIISTLIIGVLVISTLFSSFVSADPELKDSNNVNHDENIQYLINAEIMDAELLLTSYESLTRAQLVKMLVLVNELDIEECTESSFFDVPADHWALNYIETARKANYTNGCGNNTFKPDKTVTRAEIATLLVRAYNADHDENSEEMDSEDNNPSSSESIEDIVFEDIDSSHWAYEYVKIAVANEIISVFEEDGRLYFKPSQVVTLKESAVVLSNHMKRLNKGKEDVAEIVEDTENNESSTRPTRRYSKPKKDLALQEDDIKTISESIKEHFNDDTNLDSTVNIAGISFKNFTGDVNDITLEPISTDDVTIYGSNGNAISRTIPGLTGSVFEFETNNENFSSATLTFDIQNVSSTDIDNLVAVYYNESSHTFEFLETIIDKNNKTVSFTTTHNSKYFLIDKEEWEKAWKKEITVTQSVYDGEYIDFSFIIDSSGSMSWNDPNDLRKDAVVDLATTLNFDLNSPLLTEYVTVTKAVYNDVYGITSFELDTVVNSVYSDSDRIAVIDFDNSVRTLCTFTADPQTVSDAVYLIDSSGGTDMFTGIKRAIEVYEGHSKESQRKIAVLFTDGMNNYDPQEQHWDIVDAAVENRITIITMALGDERDIDSSLLRKIAEMTGGQYYKISTSEEINDQFAFIQEHTQMGVDSDGDGINDVDEISGLRLRNGMIVHTDPSNPDTDGDGITDGDELGNIITITLTEDMLPPNSSLVGQQFQVYDFNSFPDDKNSK